MPRDPLIDQIDDAAYVSEEDSDFAPDDALGGAPAEAGKQAESGSGSESESGSEEDEHKDSKPTGANPKRKRANTDASEDDLVDSGDEAIIQKGRKRQKKARRTNGEVEDEGGEGGFVKTRRQRAQEKAERKSTAAIGPVTINVDDLWAQMNAAPLIPLKKDTAQDKENQDGRQRSTDVKPHPTNTASAKSDDADASQMIKIKRTYNFAGKVHTEEKLVARDSAEAKLYLASQDPKFAAESKDEDEQPKRNPRKAFRSMFEPVNERLVERADLNLGMTIRLEIRERQAKAKKLNVVEKSRMDWAGFVDKEGIKDELELAGKSKESYVSRQDFLQRVEAKKDDEARRARIAGRV